MLKEKKNKPQNIIDKGVSEGLQLKLKKKKLIYLSVIEKTLFKRNKNPKLH